MSKKVHIGVNDDAKVKFKNEMVALDKHIDVLMSGFDEILKDKGCRGVFVDTLSSFASSLESILKDSFTTMYTLLDTHDKTFDSEITSTDK